MLLVLALLLAPTPDLARRCLDAEHAPSCDRWIAVLGASATRSQLHRACAFEAPVACARIARYTRDPVIKARALTVACRADPAACAQLVDAGADPRLPDAARSQARAATWAACRRWPEVCYRIGRRALSDGRPTAGRRALERGCRGKDPRACGALAWRLAEGDGLPKDASAARRFGDLACRHGDRRLCLHRLRQRQAAGDHVAIARSCRRGDRLSCAARDARACRRGDQTACDRAATTPAGVCRPVATPCTRDHMPFPPGGGAPCPMADPCAYAVATQRRAAMRSLRDLASRCQPARTAVRIGVARSGDVFNVDLQPPNDCLRAALSALQVPPAEAPTRMRAMIRFVRDRPHVALHARAVPGPPAPKNPLLRLGR